MFVKTAVFFVIFIDLKSTLLKGKKYTIKLGKLIIIRSNKNLFISVVTADRIFFFVPIRFGNDYRFLYINEPILLIN